MEGTFLLPPPQGELIRGAAVRKGKENGGNKIHQLERGKKIKIYQHFQNLWLMREHLPVQQRQYSPKLADCLPVGTNLPPSSPPPPPKFVPRAPATETKFSGEGCLPSPPPPPRCLYHHYGGGGGLACAGNLPGTDAGEAEGGPQQEGR